MQNEQVTMVYNMQVCSVSILKIQKNILENCMQNEEATKIYFWSIFIL